MDHPAQLCSAFDRRSIHRQDDVVLLDASFAGRSILVDHRHFYTLFLFQFQGGQALGGDVRNIDAEVRSRAAVLAGNNPRMCWLIYRPVLRSLEKPTSNNSKPPTITNCLRMVIPSICLPQMQ